MVRVPPQSTVSGRVRVVVVECLWVIKAFYANSSVLGGEEADGGENGKTKHRGDDTSS